MKRFLILLTIFLTYSLIAQDNCKFLINGYTQVRMETNYKSNPNFYIRRTRLWIDSKLPYGNGEFLFRTKFYFTKGVEYPKLMDAKIGYRYKNLILWIGQQVPDFGRQIIKGDSKILLGERANYYYYLAPGEESLLRDIGIQLFYKFKNRGHISFGYFNGYFANNYLSQNKNILITHRFTYSLIKNKDNFLDIGYSLMYRRANELYMPKLLTDTFTGIDIRYEIEFETKIYNYNLEIGFTKAYLKDTDKKLLYQAKGFFAHLNYYFTHKDIGILAIDYLYLPKDYCQNRVITPWYALGYTHLFNSHKIKLSVNQWFKFNQTNLTTFTRIQFQIFIH